MLHPDTTDSSCLPQVLLVISRLTQHLWSTLVQPTILSFSHTNLGVLLPGESSTTELEVTSLSSSEGNWTWTSTVVAGDCSSELSELQSNIMEGQVYQIEVDVTAGVNTHVNDECKVRIDGVLDHDSSITEAYEFSVYVGEEWGLAMVLPSMITLDVGNRRNLQRGSHK